MDEDDPEKRIAELERQLADTNWAASDDGPPARPSDAHTGQAAQGFSPSAPSFAPAAGWQQPSQGSLAWRPQSRRRYGAFLIPCIVLVGVAGLVLTLVLYFNPFSSGPTQLHTAEGLSGLLTEVRDHFGDTMGFRLAVHPNYAIISRVNPQENRAEQSYYYRSGDWSDFGDPTPAEGDLTDLSKFDAEDVAATLATAPQTLTITNPQQIYLTVKGGGESLSLAIHVSGGGVSGHMEINADGTVRELYPPS